MLRRVRSSPVAGRWRARNTSARATASRLRNLEQLTSLVDKTSSSPMSTRARRAIECWRPYASTRSTACATAAKNRDAESALRVGRRTAEESFEPLTGPDQALWLDRLAPGALRTPSRGAAMAIDHKLPDAFRMAPNLSRWWVRRAHLTEAREWFTRLLDTIPGDQAKRDRGRALSAVGNMAMYQGDHDEAGRLFRETLALSRELGDARRSAYTQTNLALLASVRGQYADAEPLLVECATLARTLDDAALLAVNLGNLAIVVHARGDGDRARRLFEEVLTLARGAGQQYPHQSGAP